MPKSPLPCFAHAGSKGLDTRSGTRSRARPCFLDTTGFFTFFKVEKVAGRKEERDYLIDGAREGDSIDGASSEERDSFLLVNKGWRKKGERSKNPV